MNDNPLVAQEQDSTQGYTGIGIAESVTDLVQGIQSGNWVDIGLGGLTTGLEALSIVMDPIGDHRHRGLDGHCGRRLPRAGRGHRGADRGRGAGGRRSGQRGGDGGHGGRRRPGDGA